MNIALISFEYPPDTGKGGIGTYTFQTAEALSSLGHSISIFTASYTREFSEISGNKVVYRIRLQSEKEFSGKVLIKFTEIHRLIPFDLIECPEIGGYAAQIKNKYPKIPLIVRLHTPGVLVTRLQNTYVPLISKLRFVTGAIIRGRLDWGYWSKHDKNQQNDPDYLITKEAVKIIAPSKVMNDWAARFWRINPARIDIIPNPFSPDPKLLSVPVISNSKRITFIGRLNVLKGVVGLTESLPKVLKKNPEWKFRFIGTNESSHIKGKDMKQWIKKFLDKYNSQIEFIEWVDYDQLYQYFSETEICVFPSLFESFSYVCAEAMAAGKAIIGSSTSAMVELLDNGKCGILVNPKNKYKLANSINYLIENNEKRKEFGMKARQRILEEYNSEIIGKKIERVYLSVVNS